MPGSLCLSVVRMFQHDEKYCFLQYCLSSHAALASVKHLVRTMRFKMETCSVKLNSMDAQNTTEDGCRNIRERNASVQM